MEFICGIMFVVVIVLFVIVAYMAAKISNLLEEMKISAKYIAENRNRIRILTKRIRALEKGEKVDMSTVVYNVDDLDK